MSPEKQRVAIATACGWINVKPVVVQNVKHQGDDITVGISSDSGWIPDYLNDLNACHEMEKVLTVSQRVTYAFQIGVVLSGGSVGRAIPDWWFIHIATPAQRAEAFLRTLGLWEKDANTAKSASSTSSATEESSVTRLLALAQPVMEAYAKSHELDEWHCRCEDIIGTAYPRKLLDENS